MRHTAISVTEALCEWFLAEYQGAPWAFGTPLMLCDRARVGGFAAPVDAIEAGRDDALFRLLVTTTMFQRRQDLQIMRILAGMSAADAAALSALPALVTLATEAACAHARSQASLLERCDLTKDTRGAGTCAAGDDPDCYLKRHTVLLKRYGHFGKVPTSIAHMVNDSGGSLNALRDGVYREHRTRRARAIALERALSSAWRVSEKIAAMFLSAVTNPDLGLRPPWRGGVDWTWFVVVDSNVDLYLASIGYDGKKTYAARREFIIELSRKIDLRRWGGRRRFNPRIVQQAMYTFMSVTNRRATPEDCSARPQENCPRCPKPLKERCGLYRAPR